MPINSSKKTQSRFVSVAVLLLSLLVVGIMARVHGVAEGTEIIFTSLAGFGLLVNSWLGK